MTIQDFVRMVLFVRFCSYVFGNDYVSTSLLPFRLMDTNCLG